MIKTAIVTINENEYVRIWSDQSMMLNRDGSLYEEAIDPMDSGRIYTETDLPITYDEQATEADYLAALDKLGVSAND